jgi:hypothetical protein
MGSRKVATQLAPETVMSEQKMNFRAGHRFAAHLILMGSE